MKKTSQIQNTFIPDSQLCMQMECLFFTHITKELSHHLITYDFVMKMIKHNSENVVFNPTIKHNLLIFCNVLHFDKMFNKLQCFNLHYDDVTHKSDLLEG